MSSISGKVTDIKTSDYNGKKYYNVFVNGKSYSAGMYPPKGVSVGDYISFNVDDPAAKYPRMDTKSVAKVEPTNEVREASAVATKSYGASEDKKQQVISRQAAHNTAVAVFNQLVALDAVPIPKTAKAGDKFDLVLGIVDKLSDHFYNRSMGIESAEKPAGPSVEVKGKDPSDDEYDN